MEQSGLIAEIIVDLNAIRTDRVFHYCIPPEFKDIVTVGSRVLVPFGGRKLAGYVASFGQPVEKVKLKNIAGVLDADPVLTPELLVLARWMAENYLCGTSEALARILSPRLGIKGHREVKLLSASLPVSEAGDILTSMADRFPKQAAALRQAVNCPGLKRSELAAAACVSVATVDILVRKGLLNSTSSKQLRLTGKPAEYMGRSDCLELNLEQAAALKRISDGLADNKFLAFLLHGVTGSGKTEVYLQAIAAALRTGRQAAALVPEISLTPQMVELFRKRFGDQVAVLHSSLSGGERYDEWRRIKEGHAPVVLGTRSAVFAPFTQPGIFILDEEHEPSYKQDDHLRYHAREVALKRALLSNAVVVLGSATPSLESQFRASSLGPYQLLTLSHRIDKRPLPPVRIIDLRAEIKNGNRSIFSRCLEAAVNERLEKGEQTLLFLNRRGYTTFVVCRECGLVLKCPHCDISLTYHLVGLLRCHYCNYTSSLPALCPGCGSDYIRQFGAGTQKVEEEAHRLFPRARIVRMDSDTTSRKGSHERIFNAFRKGQADILIGTQMIAKGLDLPDITLVGVINADSTLYMPDFRAAERTFQLLTQVAGRTGRGSLPGEVLVQTYSPEHYSITSAAAHDCEGFYRSELMLRRALGYPPFSHLARLLFTHAAEDEVKKGAEQVRELLERVITTGSFAVDILGPAPAPLSRIKGQYRWQLVLKGPQRSSLRDVIRKVLSNLESKRPPFKLVVNVDINPQGMF